MYKSTLVVTKLIEVEREIGDNYLKLDLPFEIYGQNIVCKGSDVTYRRGTALKGTEVLAKVDYDVKDTSKVKQFAGNIGSKWKDLKKHAKYAEHFNHKKEDAKATYTYDEQRNGTKHKYTGADKDELVKFTQWEE